MGILNAILGHYVYLDANIFIYGLEGHPDYAQEISELFKAIDQGQFQAVTSELTLAETLVKPIMDGNSVNETAYQEAIQSSASLYVVSVNRRVLSEAARIRANSGMRLPDSIHAATSQLGLCETFLTNDPEFRRVPGLPVVVRSEVIAP